MASASPAMAGTGAAVAFVERSFAVEGERLKEAANWTDVAHVEHAGQRVARPPRRYNLEVGDRLVVDQPGYVVFVHNLTDNTLVPVRRGAPWEAKRYSLAGLADSALAWIEEQLSGADQSRITTSGLATLGTRGGGAAKLCYNAAATDQPTPFTMPIFAAAQSAISGDHKVLVVPWSGGVAPFAIRLIDVTSGAEVAAQTRFDSGCIARLATPPLHPGRYRLVVKDAQGSAMEESNVLVGETPPAMPEPLLHAPVSEIDRKIYYATWLSAIEGGKWQFEALQMVAAMDCSKPAVRDWLSRWGEFTSCAG